MSSRHELVVVTEVKREATIVAQSEQTLLQAKKAEVARSRRHPEVGGQGMSVHRLREIAPANGRRRCGMKREDY
jgi:hypothetical protein